MILESPRTNVWSVPSMTGHPSWSRMRRQPCSFEVEGQVRQSLKFSKILLEPQNSHITAFYCLTAFLSSIHSRNLRQCFSKGIITFPNIIGAYPLRWYVICVQKECNEAIWWCNIYCESITWCTHLHFNCFNVSLDRNFLPRRMMHHSSCSDHTVKRGQITL